MHTPGLFRRGVRLCSRWPYYSNGLLEDMKMLNAAMGAPVIDDPRNRFRYSWRRPRSHSIQFDHLPRL